MLRHSLFLESGTATAEFPENSEIRLGDTAGGFWSDVVERFYACGRGRGGRRGMCALVCTMVQSANIHLNCSSCFVERARLEGLDVYPQE